MKNKLVLSISGIMFVMFPLFSFGQSSVSYGYDANGNRTSAVVTLKKATEKESADTTLNNAYVFEMKNAVETEGLTNYNVKAFPNPAQGRVHLTTNLEGTVRYTLYDMNGKKHLEGTMVKQTDIDLSTAKAGMYFLKLHARKEDLKKTIKILKK